MKLRYYMPALLILALSLVSPAFSGFAASDLVYLPVAAATPGAEESFWRTDLYVTSVEDEAALDVCLVYLPSGLRDNSSLFENRDQWLGGRESEGFGFVDESLADIPARGAVVLADVVGQHWSEDPGLDGAGAIVIFAYEAGTLDQDGGRIPRNVVVTSRTYTDEVIYLPDPDNEGEFIEQVATYGQSVPGVPWYNLGDAGAVNEDHDLAFQVLAGGTKDENFRYNVGILNASDRQTQLTMLIQPFGPDGSPFLDSNEEEVSFTVVMPPLSQIQYNDVISESLELAEGEPVTVVVSIRSFTTVSTDPIPVFTSYASVIDNRSNDPTTILPSFAYPYDVECMWGGDEVVDPGAVPDGGMKPQEAAGRVQRRPLDIPGN